MINCVCGHRVAEHNDAILTFCLMPNCTCPKYSTEHRDHDPVNHPAHYTQGKIECIEAIESALGQEGFRAFLRGQVMKYIWRGPHKTKALEDYKKTAWYLDRLIKSLETNNEQTKG